MATGTRGDTRARILDTAWKLVQERGVGAVTVADIAAATGGRAAASATRPANPLRASWRRAMATSSPARFSKWM